MDGPALAPDFQDHRRGQLVELHAHEGGQVLLATEGRMDVRLGAVRLDLTPSMAVWVPPGAPHAARALEPTAFRGVLLDIPSAARLPAAPSRFRATPTFVAAATGLAAAQAEPRALAARLLLDELRSSLALQTGPTMPLDARLAELCAEVLEDLTEVPSLDEAARRAGMSRRTFTRAFRAATGLALIEWVREARLAKAASLLTTGLCVTDAAMAVGYATPSAFSVAFRRGSGMPPVRLRRQQSP